jgi:hypothetical protein
MFGDFEKNGFSWWRKKLWPLFFPASLRTRGDNNKTRVDEMKKDRGRGMKMYNVIGKSFCCA